MCTNCSECSISAQHLTRKEQTELLLMENNMWINEKEKIMVEKIPVRKGPSVITNNYNQVVEVTGHWPVTTQSWGSVSCSSISAVFLCLLWFLITNIAAELPGGN